MAMASSSSSSSQGIQLLVQLSIIMHMILVQVVVVVVVVLSLSSSAAVAAPTTADLEKYGCTERCGNVRIPYPFGVKKNCYRNEDFLINCSQSHPYLRRSNIPVTNISLEGELRIMHFISRNCYDQFGTPSKENVNASLTIAKFSISSTKNKFTTMGCDTYGYLLIYENGVHVSSTGCASQCSGIEHVPNGTCSGIGCCQISIPNGVANFDNEAFSVNNHTSVSTFNPCSYAFVVEEGAFNFSTTYLRDFKAESMPMVLDWTILDNHTCEEAKTIRSSYACGDHSDCYKATNVAGYICKCLDGYRGNPYLSDGCQDINECGDPNLNQCVHESNCFNWPGNYTCKCPKGYHGDGRTNGTRCNPDRFVVIQIVVGSIVGVTVVMVCSSWLYWIFRKRRLVKLKEKFFLQNGGLMLQQQLSKLERSTQEVFKIFTKEELEQATNNYDESKIIGEGGNGIVYKGTLADNRIVAIKKSKVVDQSKIEQFINEIFVLSQINHRNVVKLLGCCLETQGPRLVYEFITNGTLSNHIHHEPTIPWQTRLQVAVETARVLSYLHSEASTPIIHRDVKPTNILLDDNYTAKVSDFGASKLVPLDQIRLATVVEGTLGYLDPEYLHTNQLTEKSDVYSFGVVLAELITGKKAFAFDRSEEERCLATIFLSSLKNNRFYHVIDEHIVIEGDTDDQLKEVAGLAERCLKVKGDERPTMKEVAMELEGLIKKMMEKHPRVKTKSDVNFEETKDLLGGKSSGHEFGGCSSNTATTEFYSETENIILPLDGGR